MSRTATALALLTISLWGFSSFAIVHLTQVPAFLIVGATLSIGGLISIFRLRDWNVPVTTLAVGIGGLFGYHFLLYTAFKIAPAVEVNTLNYLWPLLIVALTPVFLPTHALAPQHILGILLGLAGAVLVVSGGHFTVDPAYATGYLCAAGAALIWASYSLLCKRLPKFSSYAVGGFALAAGLLALTVYFLGTSSATLTISHLSTVDWFYIIVLGVGPQGIAFFAWDAALKRGDPRLIGALSYLTPLLSTLVLVVLDGRVITLSVAVALVLIVGGAAVSSFDMRRLGWQA